ncbi:hypothetical protein JW890_05130 [candidate division WOR-3 bacterium]|nr:hypothetical protein [candidate division WOR-3 bacterium]
MIYLIFLSVAVFLGTMLPTFLVSVLHKTAVKILEALRFYEKGKLKAEKRTYITGSGHHRNAIVYIYSTPDGREKFENAKVFGCLFLVFEILFITIAIILLFVLKIFFKF